MQLGVGKGVFRRRRLWIWLRVLMLGNGLAVEIMFSCSLHSLTDPVAMWHVRAEIAPAVLLVVDFGRWYRLDSQASSGNSSDMIQHTQVSLLKDVIVPYTHLLPRLQLSEDHNRPTLLYFKGAKHRNRVSTFLNLENLCFK
ncbi:hypothetical protein IFM89_002495 [Coptis chinensis]|uniref:Uncharacterized protein n=1 Tax=Coptis chinensis TaxID=261450 RepID=A0A835LPG1_9MAGN|nr:hypothetical protein IFM89_002495 [Coptis chinensis]